MTAAQPLPAASTARFSHPDLERISGQLHQTSEKSPVHLLVYSAALVGAIVTALFLLYLPLSAREPVRLGFLAVSQTTFYLCGFAFVFSSLIFSVRGLSWYNSIQSPRAEMEQLSERQMRLMGWSDEQITREHGRRSRIDEEEERLQDRNATRARARVQQLTGVAAAAARTPHTKHPVSSARVLSPSASLRFLHSSPPAARLNAAELSPFRSRGLDSSLSPAGASRIHDEAGLNSFVREYDQQRAHKMAHGNGEHGQATPSHGSSGFSNPFSTPSPNGRSMGTSPRGGFGSSGLFGFGASASAASHTPPYQTSLRETAAVPKSAASLSLSTATNASLNAGPNAVSTFSFTLPNHRFPLDDPRSDNDLHDSFHVQLKTQLRTTANVVDQWSRNMRIWIVQQILRPQLQQLDVSNAALARFANFILQQPGVGQAFTENELNLMRELAQAFGVQHSTPPLLTARHEEAVSLLITRFPARPEIISRIAIERYLSVDEKATTAPVATGQPAGVSAVTRAYVAQRLQTLCAPGDDALSKFNASVPQMGGSHLRTNPSAGLFGTRTMFNAAGGPAAAASSPASASNFPSDTDLILHAFCTFLSTVQSNFRQQFIKGFNQCSLTHAQLSASAHAAQSRSTASLSGGSESCAIAQVRAPSLAPYFVVTHSSSGPGGVRREAVKLVTEPGRASLFQAMVMWILDLPRGSPMLREFAGVIA